MIIGIINYKFITIILAVMITSFEIIPSVNGEANLMVVKVKDRHSQAVYQKISRHMTSLATDPLSFLSPLGKINRERENLVHSSFRLKKSILRSLDIEAAKRGIPVSMLVNKILENYFTHDIHFEELGFLLVSKEFLRTAFDSLDDTRSQGLGRQLGLSVAKEYISFFFPEVNGDNLAKFLDLWFKRFQSYRHSVDDNRHYFFVKHEINMNFSIALKAMLQDLIKPIVKNSVVFNDLTSQIISFSFVIVDI